MSGMEMPIAHVVDAAWLVELIILAASWVILCRGIRWGADTLRNCLEFVGLLAVLIITNLLTVFVSSFFLLSWMLMRGLVSGIFMRLRSTYQPSVSVVMWCSMYAGICCLSSIAGQSSLLSCVFFGSGPHEGIVRCCVNLLAIPLALYLRAFNFDSYRIVPHSGFALIMVEDMVMLVLVLVEMLVAFDSGVKTNLTLLTTFSGMFLIVLISIYMLYSMCREQDSILELQAERQRLQSEKELGHISDIALEELRCIRHDLKNQYTYMQILLDTEQYAELKEYFGKLSDNLPAQLTAIDCGNRAINTVLNMELSKAKKEGIPVSHQLVVPPTLPFADDELCAIVANLMDNAIEECERLREKGRTDVGVSIEIYPRRSYLFLTCKNTTDLQKLERWQNGLRTTKKDPHLHGYGTRIVYRLAEKYNGCAEYSLEDGVFTAMVMLDMMQKEVRK